MSGAGFLFDAFWRALKLIFSGDADIYSAVSISLQVAGTATAISTALGVPLGLALTLKRFRGRQFVITLLNTLMALPTVVVGIFIYAFISSGSLLGPLELLFTRKAMIIGEVILALPIVTALTHAALSTLDKAIRETAVTLGASRVRVWATMLYEGRFALIAVIAVAFGRLIGEVGISMILGGNIQHSTRSITTAIALQNAKGEFAFAMALGIVLLALALGVNFLLRYFQGKGEVP